MLTAQLSQNMYYLQLLPLIFVLISGKEGT